MKTMKLGGGIDPNEIAFMKGCFVEGLSTWTQMRSSIINNKNVLIRSFWLRAIKQFRGCYPIVDRIKGYFVWNDPWLAEQITIGAISKCFNVYIGAKQPQLSEDINQVYAGKRHSAFLSEWYYLDKSKLLSLCVSVYKKIQDRLARQLEGGTTGTGNLGATINKSVVTQWSAKTQEIENYVMSKDFLLNKNAAIVGFIIGGMTGNRLAMGIAWFVGHWIIVDDVIEAFAEIKKLGEVK